MNTKTKSAGCGRGDLILPFAWLAIMMFIIARAWVLCDGRLVFALDDPIIHMSVSEKLLGGTYGINAGEPSAPSSSILWPFLLTVTEAVGWGLWGPLAINVCAMFAAVLLIARMIREALPPLPPWGLSGLAWGAARLGLGLLACMACNSWGLVMTGMEHSLHLYAGLLFAMACLRLAENPQGEVRLLVAAACVLPLIRFEGAAAAAAGLLLLLWLRRWRPAGCLAGLLMLELAAWALFTYSQGLPVMPSSVQMKSALVSGIAGQDGLGRIVGLLLHNLKVSFALRQGALVLVLMVVLGLMAAASARLGQVRFTATLLLVALAHVCFGQYGWFSRYEIYLLALLIYAILAVGREFWLRRECVVTLGCLLAIVAAPYVRTALNAPAAARSIYEQQVQMRRFAVDFWKQPVAVVDLGWVSYHNPAYVLDLEGLGSEEVRKLRKNGTFDAAHVEALAQRHQVRLAMIYDERAGHVMPEMWRKVAVLRTSGVELPSDKVCFYLADPGLHDELIARLKAFEKGLPSGSKLEFLR